MAYNASKFIYNPTQGPGPNIAEGLFKLADINIRKSQIEEGARQADQQQANLMQRHAVDSTRLENQRKDVNNRFNVKLKDDQRSEALKYSRQDQDKVQASVMQLGKLVAAGDYRGAMAMTPAMKAMGVEVKTTANEDGSFNFDVQAPTFGDKEGDITQSQETEGDTTEAPGAALDDLEGRKPDEPVIDDVSGAGLEQDSMPSAQISADMGQGVQPEQPVADQVAQMLPQEQEQGELVPQTTLNSGLMEQVTKRRLNPMLGGIIGSYPGRFQGEMGRLASGFADSGLPADKVLDMMKAPQAQATSLMKAQMGAEAAARRAHISQGGAGFSEARQREATAYNNMSKQAKQLGVDDAVLQLDNIVTIRRGLDSDNPNLLSASIKQLMLQDEKRLTDADFLIGFKGIASDSDQFKQRMGNLIHNLTPAQRKRFKQWADESAEKQKRRIQTASKHLTRQADGYRYESGRLGANRYLSSGIPPQYLDKDMSYWNPSQSQGGEATPRTQSNRSSASVSSSSKSQPKTPDEEAYEFL
jgi:hypothetical protein